jgi:glycosyltransferase involved in cell wall biosynthesis
MRADGRRVLLVCPQSTGGIGRHVAMLARELRRNGEHVTVAAPADTAARFAFAAAADELVELDAGRLAPAAARRLRRLVSGHDVVHAHGVRVAALCAAVGARPLVSSWHNAPLGRAARRLVHASLERVSARRSAVVLGASADLVERARRAGAVDARLCPVVTPLPREPVAEPATPPIVLAVARLHRQKRIDLLVEAAAPWRDRPDGVRVVVAGDGPLRESLVDRARRAHAPVEFLGAVEDVRPLLRRATVVALTSDWEARALVAQEALAAGVPLVATRVGGIPELVGDAAVLVPPGDAGALRAALERVLADRPLREWLRTAGRARAATWPDAAAMTSVVRASYDVATGSARDARDAP